MPMNQTKMIQKNNNYNVFRKNKVCITPYFFVYVFVLLDSLNDILLSSEVKS